MLKQIVFYPKDLVFKTVSVPLALFFETPKPLQFGLAYADGDSYMSLLQQFR